MHHATGQCHEACTTCAASYVESQPDAHGVLVGNAPRLSGRESAWWSGPDDVVRAGALAAEVPEHVVAYHAARAVTLFVMASIKRKLGDLGRVEGVVRFYGMIDSPLDLERRSAVTEGASHLPFELWRPKLGQDARAQINISELPLRSAVGIMRELDVA